MLHLSPERLAALADSEPTMAESEHLAGCALCARERIAYRSLLAHAVAERTRDALPLTRWDAVARAVRDEGIFTSARLTRRGSPWWLRAAAAVVLVAGGVAVGRATVTIPAAPAIAGTFGTAGDTVDDGSATFASRTEALAAMARSENLYQQAAAFLVERDSSEREIDDSQVYRRRLAALDEVAATTEAALRDAPYDPVINRYYLTALGARQATLRQLRSALPDGEQLYRY
jgi:hypothetical protein